MVLVVELYRYLCYSGQSFLIRQVVPVGERDQKVDISIPDVQYQEESGHNSRYRRYVGDTNRYNPPEDIPQIDINVRIK